MNDTNENRDPMTGLWNHKYALAALEKCVATCSQVALMFLDIDRLKPFHDSYGHPPTDEKIIEIAHEIENFSSKNALACRFGGDEFLVILPETPLERAREIAEDIRAQRKSFHFRSWDGTEGVICSLSIGLAHFPTHVLSAEHLLHAADLALLKAKRGGRLPDATSYTARNRVIAIGDFLDDFPQQSARFLKPEWIMDEKNRGQS